MLGRLVQMDEVEIAKICYTANRGYRQALNEPDEGPWEAASDATRNSTIAGVRYVAKNPDTTPEQTHEAWLRDKEAQGFVYGPEKDLEAKTHPCMLPYDQLPQEQRVKDYIFLAIVKAYL